MKLRIARKMDPKRRTRDKRLWWSVYTDEQLQRAVSRLEKSWLRSSPVVDGMRNVAGTDFFAMNRVDARLIRQRAIRRIRRREAGRA